MKYTLLIASLFSLTIHAQDGTQNEKDKTSYGPQDFKSIGATVTELGNLANLSRAELEANASEEEKKLIPFWEVLRIDIEVPNESLFDTNEDSFQGRLALNNLTSPSPLINNSPLFCKKPFALSETSKLLNNIDQIGKYEQKVEMKKKKMDWSQGQLCFTWGYNWTEYSKTNVTFDMPEGSYTIHDVKGVDRPSPASAYLDVVNITVPQYNVKLCYKMPLKNQKTKIGVAVGMDHMKWIAPFFKGGKYQVTGDYNREVYVKDEYGGFKKVDFDYVKETGDLTYFAMVEHTNGYNFAHLKLMIDQTLLSNKSKTFQVIGHLTASGGLMIPKTEINQQVDVDGQRVREGLDNEFHVAGWGAGVGVGLGVQYQPKNSRVGLELSTQQDFGFSKINNALVKGKGQGNMSDSGIWWWQRQPVLLTINYKLYKNKTKSRPPLQE